MHGNRKRGRKGLRTKRRGGRRRGVGVGRVGDAGRQGRERGAVGGGGGGEIITETGWNSHCNVYEQALKCLLTPRSSLSSLIRLPGSAVNC